MSEMKDRFFPISRPILNGRELEYVTDAVKSGWISSIGPYVTRFEEEFANYCGVNNAIAVCNGTVALHLALIAAGIGPGDEVIVPDLTFIATANAVLMAGARPIFCDIDAHTLCIDPEIIVQMITRSTRAIIAVHLYGHPAAMNTLMTIANRYGLLVIEDAAEAHGAELNGRRVGSMGHCATFSFYGNKNMTTGEGGMITTNCSDLAARCRRLRDHAMSAEKRYWHNELGYNYRITNVQAAIGCAQLEQLEQFIEARKNVFNGYYKRLSGIKEISLNRTLDNARNAYWMICLELDGASGADRDDFIKRLRAKGVDTRPYFYPMSKMPYLEDANTPIAHEISQKGLNLPTMVDLTEDDLDIICEVITSELTNA